MGQGGSKPEEEQVVDKRASALIIMPPGENGAVSQPDGPSSPTMASTPTSSKGTTKKTFTGRLRKSLPASAEELALIDSEMLVANVLANYKEATKSASRLNQSRSDNDVGGENENTTTNNNMSNKLFGQGSSTTYKNNGDASQRITRIRQEIQTFVEKESTPNRQAGWDTFIKHLRAAEMVPKALKAGAVAPKFSLKNVKGETVELEALLSKGSVVLSFIPGVWSPDFTSYIEQLKEGLIKIKRSNSQLITVYPGPLDEAALNALKELNVEFDVLGDPILKVAQEYSLAYKLPTPVYNVFAEDNDVKWEYGPRIPGGGENGVIVLNPSYVISPTDGVVSYVHCDSDVHKRPPVMEIVNALGWL